VPVFEGKPRRAVSDRTWSSEAKQAGHKVLVQSWVLFEVQGEAVGGHDPGESHNTIYVLKTGKGHTSVIPAFGRPRWEDLEFRPAWVTQTSLDAISTCVRAFLTSLPCAQTTLSLKTNEKKKEIKRSVQDSLEKRVGRVKFIFSPKMLISFIHLFLSYLLIQVLFRAESQTSGF
jgi:hypothetical protein